MPTRAKGKMLLKQHALGAQNVVSDILSCRNLKFGVISWCFEEFIEHRLLCVIIKDNCQNLGGKSEKWK